MSGKFIEHKTCPSCGSKDNLAVYDDHEYCFGMGCDHYINYETGGKDKSNMTTEEKETKNKKPIRPLPEKRMPDAESRGISSDVIMAYNVSVSNNEKSLIEAVFPRFDADGKHVANQFRGRGKKFRWEGDLKGAAMFGTNLFPKGGRSITITEGYYDTLAAYQMTGERYPNVGVASASTAKKEVTDNFEYLDSFDKIIINFDNDDPGNQAAEACSLLFTPGKVRILKLKKHKDANDYLMAEESREYINEWHRAPSFTPDGLKLGSDLWEDIKDHKIPHSVPFPWEGLNRSTYGMRRSELTLFLADTGIGKTTFCKEIEYNLLMNEELKEEGAGVGFLHLEEPKYDTAMGLMSIYSEKPYHLPDTDRTDQELKEAFDAVINNDRVVIWDHFGSNDIETVLGKIRHMAAMGCKYVVVDHLSIIVSDQSGDERKQLDEISTKLKTLIMNLNISCVCVIHINRNGQARGSAGPEQVANTVVRLERDKKEADEWRRNVTGMVVEKCRLTGRTGTACYVYYDAEAHRLRELSRELADQFEQGGNEAGNEFEGTK